MKAFRRLMGVLVIIGALLYIPYAFYSARMQRLAAESAVPARGAVVRADEVKCKNLSSRYSHLYACDVAVIADVNTTPPWTGRVVITTTTAPSKGRAQELAREKLAAFKARDALSLYVVTRRGELDYISEDGLSETRRAGDPLNNVYLLCAPLIILMSALIVWWHRNG